MSSNLLKQAWLCCRNFGPDEAFFRILKRLKLMTQANSLDLMIEDLESYSAPDLPQNPEFVIRELQRSELRNFKMADGLPAEEDFQKQFEQGSRLFAVLHKDKIVGVNWANTSSANLAHINKPAQTFQNGVIYSYSLFISPSFRDQHLGKILKHFLLSAFKKEGFRLALIAIFLKDVRVRQWHEKNGFKTWGRVFYFKFAGKKFWWTRLTETGKKLPQLLNFHA